MDRLRNTLLLGIGIPGVLGFLGLLYPAALWAAVLLLVILRQWRAPNVAAFHENGLYATFGAAFLILWPPLSRPLLDGDSLEYHLPNAVAWLQHHSIWITSAPYWYYPPASELFAAGLIGAGSRFSAPLAGACAALLLTGRIYVFAQSAGAPRYAAASVSLALLFTPIFAFEAGTLQNDLWLAAFFVEVLAASSAAAGALAICALLKPFGFIEAVIALVTARKPLRIYFIGLIPLAVWLLRDVILLQRGPVVAIASRPPYWFTALAGNAAQAVPQLLHGIAAYAPQCFVWLAPVACGLFSRATRRYALAGLAAIVLYAFLPFSYRSVATNYVLDGSSVRFMLPAFACGALIAALWAARWPKGVGIGGAALAAGGAISVLAVFWNDGWTRAAPLAAIVAVLGALLIRPTRGVSAAAAFAAIAVLGAASAQSRALSFYDNWMPMPAGSPTGVFTWLARTHPARVVTQNIRTGAVLMSSPATQAVELGGSVNPCAGARRERALLLVGSNEDLSRQALALRFAQARECGPAVYEDGAAIVVRPLP